jgi:hypothetical protein
MLIYQGSVEKGGEEEGRRREEKEKGEGRRRREEEPRTPAMPLVIFYPLTVHAR